MTIALITKAQVLCIQCYNQNAPVLTNTNNLIMNGGFENTTCIPDVSHNHSYCPNSSAYDCDFTNWTCTGGGTNTYASLYDSSIAAANNLTIIVEGDNAAYFGNNFCNACSAILSDTSCITNVDCEVTGIPSGYPVNVASYGGATGVSLEQTVSGLTSGAIYALEFWAGGEWQNVFQKRGLFAVDLGFGNIFLRNPPTPPITGIGQRYVIVFSTTSTSQTIKFTNWGHIGGNSPYNCSELILDDVRLFELISNPCPVAINELSESTDLNVYPNPVGDKLNITSNNNEVSEIIIYDIASKILLKQKFTSFVSLNTAQLAKGLYLYEIRDKNGLCKKGKFVRD